MVSRLQTSRGALHFNHRNVCGQEAIYEDSLPSEISSLLETKVGMPEPTFRVRSESEQPELVERNANGMVQAGHRVWRQAPPLLILPSQSDWADLFSTRRIK